jgi:sialate O-acetylesterase
MIRRTCFAVAVLACLDPAARAEVKPHPLISDGMVLQQGASCPIWGTCDPGEEIGLMFEKADGGLISGTKPSRVDKDGQWRINLNLNRLPEVKPGGPYVLKIESKTKTITVKDVYVGEVWIASGQSNMEMSVNTSETPNEIKANSKNPNLRLFTVRKTIADKPQSTLPLGDKYGKWLECGPDTVGSFSAVAYHFAKDLQKALNVPVGIIHTSWGGSRAEAWTSRAVLEADPNYKQEYVNFDKAREKGPSKNFNDHSVLYNGMIAPLIPYAINGAIWYQGESNAGKHKLYRELMTALIKNWRNDWRSGEFTFLIVQLAPFMKIEAEPKDTDWARLREAQLQTSMTVPKVGLAVITDVGNEKDIHPKPKEPVGARLALAARAIAYGEKVEYSGPAYESLKVEGNKAILSFKHLGDGLVAKGGPLTGFTVAGEDKKFYNAQAEIQDGKIIVTCNKVEKPVAVRFGWANYPVVNLWNKAGLPASPFRTDSWEQAK